MKLILKPLKWLLYLVGFIIVLLAILVGLAYKSVTPPKIESDAVSLKELLDENIALLVDNDNVDKVLNLPLNEESINKTLKETLTTDDSTEEYVITNGKLLIQGAWIDYKNEMLNVNVGVHLDLGFIKFKSNVSLGISVTLNETTLIAKIEKINLGNLGIKWLIKLAPKVIDLEKIVIDVLGDMGSFNTKDLSLTVELNELSEKANNETIVSIVDLISNNNLVGIGYDKENKALSLKVNLNEIENKEPGLSYAQKAFNSVDELNDHLLSKALNGLMNQSNNLIFTEKNLNHILYYQLLGSNIHDLDYFKKIVAYEDYDLVIRVPYFNLVGDKLRLIVPVDFGKGTDYFNTKVMIDTKVSKKDNDLVVSLSNLTIGTLPIGEELELTILNLVTNNNGKDLIIKDFFDLLTYGQMVFEELKVTTKGLVIEYTTAIGNNLLDDLFNSPDVPNEVKNILGDIQNNLTNDEDIDSLVDDLVDSINDLSDIDKNKIYDIINGIA